MDDQIQKEMSDKERADIFLELCKISYQRFDRLADLAWKLRLAAWTALGLLAWFIISSKDWQPMLVDVVFGIAFMVCFNVAVFHWSMFNFTRSARWNRVARHWEAEVEKLTGHLLPDYLHPGKWLRMGAWSENESLKRWYHNPVYLQQTLINALLSLLCIGLLLSRADLWQYMDPAELWNGTPN